MNVFITATEHNQVFNHLLWQKEKKHMLMARTMLSQYIRFSPIPLMLSMKQFFFPHELYCTSPKRITKSIISKEAKHSSHPTLQHWDFNEGALPSPCLWNWASLHLHCRVRQTWEVPGRNHWLLTGYVTSKVKEADWGKVCHAHSWPVHYRGCSGASLLAGLSLHWGQKTQ